MIIISDYSQNLSEIYASEVQLPFIPADILSFSLGNECLFSRPIAIHRKQRSMA
jgi:hypothetical protein